MFRLALQGRPGAQAAARADRCVDHPRRRLRVRHVRADRHAQRDVRANLRQRRVRGVGRRTRHAGVLPGDNAGGTGDERALVPDSVLQTVRHVEGVSSALGVANGFAQLIYQGKAVTNGGAPNLGNAWAGNDPANPVHVVQGRPPATDGEVVIDQHSAAAVPHRSRRQRRSRRRGPHGPGDRRRHHEVRQGLHPRRRHPDDASTRTRPRCSCSTGRCAGRPCRRRQRPA